MSHPITRKSTDQPRAAAVRRHLEVVGVDVDAEHEIYHEDAVLEFEPPAWRVRWRAS